MGLASATACGGQMRSSVPSTDHNHRPSPDNLAPKNESQVAAVGDQHFKQLLFRHSFRWVGSSNIMTIKPDAVNDQMTRIAEDPL